MTGGQFSVNVEGFDRLLAYSTNGGSDMANLNDSPGDDTMRARSHKALFWGPGFDMTLRGWEDVVAHSENGGYDQAKLHDTLGDDVVLSGDDWASLSTLAGGELDLLYAAYGFDVVKAYHSEGQRQGTRSGDRRLPHARRRKQPGTCNSCSRPATDELEPRGRAPTGHAVFF